MKKELILWLEKCGMRNVTPCTLIIGGLSYTGARYLDKLCHESFYFIGEPPYKPKTCFTNQGREIYISSYMFGHRLALHPEYAEFHPFGACFTMRAWPAGDTIDKYEDKPYRRVPVILEGVTQ